MAAGGSTGDDTGASAANTPEDVARSAPEADANPAPQPLFTRAEYLAALPRLRQAAYRQIAWSIPGLLIALFCTPVASVIIARGQGHAGTYCLSAWEWVAILLFLLLMPVLGIAQRLSIDPTILSCPDSRYQSTRLALRIELLTGQATTSLGIGQDYFIGFNSAKAPITPLKVLLNTSGNLVELVDNPWTNYFTSEKVKYRRRLNIYRFLIAPAILALCVFILYHMLKSFPPIKIQYYSIAVITLWIVGFLWYLLAIQNAVRQLFLARLLQHEWQGRGSGTVSLSGVVARLYFNQARFDQLVMQGCAIANLAEPSSWQIVYTISDGVIGFLILLACFAGFEESKLLGIAMTGGMLIWYFTPGWLFGFLNYRHAGVVRQALARMSLTSELLTGRLDPNRFNLLARWPVFGQRVAFPAALNPPAFTAALRRVCFNLDWYIKPPAVALRWHWLTEFLAGALFPAMFVMDLLQGPYTGPVIDLGSIFPDYVVVLIIVLPLSLLRWPAQWYIARKRVWARELKAALNDYLESEWAKLVV